ncbi:hypothetical protein PLICRDRAFT_702259 [Plicaturopsis crispa FD-325 SS-3]|uniref:BTB domain-containing protein n=1 Tax=Plicaturopsis crispa FD-325 SS-3 TaxID=944288 RepID=A0A0C9T769_PLICR|nr:hypothetical protein PLICRDRAFT_702259 [Plicaturopsis crispa FD-325 SS-3]
MPSTRSSPGNRVSKRPRTDEPSNDARPKTSHPAKSSEIWYKDGSIVLQAENTRFRVHSTVLAQNSPIFEDMLNIGESRGEDRVEGCPLVVLHDSAQDLESLLRALYDRTYFHTKYTQSLRRIASVLRLGKKYEITHLYDDGFELLKKEYSYILWEWDRCHLHPFRLPIRYTGIVFDVINLARELDIMAILPAAFYVCIMHIKDGDILDGYTCLSTGQPQKLSSSDQKIAILGRQNAIALSMSTTFAWLDEHEMIDNCTDPDSCSARFHAISDSLWKPFPRCAALCKWDTQWEDHMCADCIAFAKSRHSEGRQRFWEKLPGCFDLDPWAKLVSRTHL